MTDKDKLIAREWAYYRETTCPCRAAERWAFDCPKHGIAALNNESKPVENGHDPSRCDDCGGVNPVWFAPNELWNLVIGGADAKDDPGGFVCPGCFIARAEAAGIRPVWELRPNRHV